MEGGREGGWEGWTEGEGGSVWGEMNEDRGKL
jgi:hypothetical protein